MKKKLIALLLTLTLVISMSSISVFAGGGAGGTLIQEVEGHKGEWVSYKGSVPIHFGVNEETVDNPDEQFYSMDGNNLGCYYYPNGEGSVQTLEQAIELFDTHIQYGKNPPFVSFNLLGKHQEDEIKSMVWVQAPENGYFIFYGDGNYGAYTDENCELNAKVTYQSGKYKGDVRYMDNTSDIIFTYQAQKGQKLYFMGSASWNTAVSIQFVYPNEKLTEPIIKMAGTNVVAGYTTPKTTVVLKQGKKTYSATSDASGLYIIKTKKLKKNSKIKMWKKEDKKNAITVIIK